MYLKIIFLSLLLGPIALQGQYPKAEVLEDLSFLKEQIKQYNPGLEQYNPDFEGESISLIQGIDEGPISSLQHFKQISQLCALSNEGHFALGNWRDTVHVGFIENRIEYLPLTVKILNDHLFVWNDFSGEQSLNRGDQILDINGVGFQRILNIARRTLPSDGAITTYTDRTFESGFSWMYYLYISDTNQFDLKVKDINGNEKKVSIAALTRQGQIENRELFFDKNSNTENDKEEFAFPEITDASAYWSLSSFDYRLVQEKGIKAKTFYKAIFKHLKAQQVLYLIIDLRGNTGGRNEFADAMVPYILKSPRRDPYLKQSVSWSGKHKRHPLPSQSKLLFEGVILVLVDGWTYSAGSTLARYLNEYGDAILIGEETGSRYEGFVAGSKQYVTLPNSGLQIGIPRYHTEFPESQKQTTSNRGLIPHHEVIYSIQDLMDGIDLHMEKVNSLIEEMENDK